MKRISLTLLLLLSVLAVSLLGHSADIREEKQVIKTYPFSGPDPVAVRAQEDSVRKSIHIFHLTTSPMRVWTKPGM